LNLSHFSEKLIEELRPIEPPRDPFFKPNGFWVSVDGADDWKAWCEAEAFALDSLAIRHRVILNDNFNILILNSPIDILQFSGEFRAHNHEYFSDYIDWLSVMKKWDGVIIAPYQWSLRHHPQTHWYYSWDCASGCIWNLNAIRSIEMINGN